MFGPQSAGKTTITERILGFPVAVVKTGIGTTRPMVLTTRRCFGATKEVCKVKGSEDAEFKEIKKENIMQWVLGQMQATGSVAGRPRISKDRIYIDVSGPDYMNRRFVDLPGFQTNEESSKGTRRAILDLLRDEMQNPDTVVVCVEDSRLDFANSNLVIAINEVFGDSNFANDPNLARRFVFAFNKADSWLSSGEITERSFLSQISSYVEGSGLVPIIVGGSIDTNDQALRAARVDGRADFDAIVQEYRGANVREADLYKQVFANLSLDKDLEACLVQKLKGFETLLGTVDALVVHRDIANAARIRQQLQHSRDDALQNIEDLKRKRRILQGANGKTPLHETRHIIKSVLDSLRQIATSDFGGASAVAASDVNDIWKYGNDAKMEEMEFALGTRNASSLPSSRAGSFQGYYDSGRAYQATDPSVIDPLPETVEAWKSQVFKTVSQLQKTSLHPSAGSISYLNTRLIGGQVYERAIAVWSSSVYQLVSPSPDDLLRLANTVGIDPEMSDPGRFDHKKAKRLAEIYIHRLTPAVQYLCQKVEFLLLKNFDTAWRTILRKHENRTFVEALGSKNVPEALKEEIRLGFQQAIRKKAGIAYNKCLSDLHNEVGKLLPYSKDRASSTGMLFAYPSIADDVRKSRTGYESVINKYIEGIFPQGFSDQIKKGIALGMAVLVTAGSIDPLLLAGLHIVRTTLMTAKKFMQKGTKPCGPPGEEVLSEDRDERLLGFAACLYSHFVPRFITSVDARMRSDLWAGMKDNNLGEAIEKSLESSDILRHAEGKAQKLDNQIQALQKKEESILQAQSMLSDVGIEFPEQDVYYGGSADTNDGDISAVPFTEYDQDPFEEKDQDSATFFGDSFSTEDETTVAASEADSFNGDKRPRKKSIGTKIVGAMRPRGRKKADDNLAPSSFNSDVEPSSFNSSVEPSSFNSSVEPFRTMGKEP